MKASLKFREEQKPLFKAKVPLSILGLPFQSGIAAGDSKELSLSLATFFDSGPSFRASYRPNDAFNPFSLVVKTGIGSFGSPIDAPMTMSAEFNFPVNGGFGLNYNSTPRFFLHFKPSFGDFSLKRSHQSTIPVFKKSLNGGVFEEDDGSIEVVEKPLEKMAALPLRSSVEEAVAGVQLGAKTVLPIRNGAVLKLRWGVKFPEGFQSLFGKDHNRTGGISPRGIPRLVLNKIGIEHVAKEDRKMKEVVGAGVGPPKKEGGGGGEGADLAETCFAVKRQMEKLRAENADLGKALEDLRAEFGNGISKGRGRGGERKSLGESNGFGNGGREMEGGVNVSDDMNNKA